MPFFFKGSLGIPRSSSGFRATGSESRVQAPRPGHAVLVGPRELLGKNRSEVTENTDVGAGKSQASHAASDHSRAESPWAGAFTSRSLSVRICETGTLAVPAPQSRRGNATRRGTQHVAPPPGEALTGPMRCGVPRQALSIRYTSLRPQDADTRNVTLQQRKLSCAGEVTCPRKTRGATRRV